MGRAVRVVYGLNAVKAAETGITETCYRRAPDGETPISLGQARALLWAGRPRDVFCRVVGRKREDGR